MRHYEHNPRKITDKQLERLKTTLGELGDLSGIVHDLNSDQIVGGNQRIKAMNAEGTQPTITERFDPPTAQGTVAAGYLEYGGERFAYRAVKWTPEQCQRANIVANAAGGDWDWSILAESFDPAMLVDAGLDADALAAMNADAAGLGAMLAEEPKEETADVGEMIDRAAELQEKWQVQRGDLWQCGKHRILCGDSTNADDVTRLMGGEKAELLLTDPPFGIDVVGSTGNIGGDTKNARAGKYDPVNGDDADFEPQHLFGLAKKLVIFGANFFCMKLYEAGQWIVWDKNRPDGTTFSDCELAWTNGKGIAVKKYKCTWDGFHREGESGARYHPTQKPVKLYCDILGDYSGAGDIILDTYLGSGGLLCACEQTGRIGRGMEIEPKYVAVSLERLSALGLECKRI